MKESFMHPLMLKRIFERINKKDRKEFSDFTGVNHYKLAKPRNHITEIRVTDDKENIYFYIKTEKDTVLIKHEKSNLMNLYFGFDMKEKTHSTATNMWQTDMWG